jgi:hypothetical protein
MQELLDLRQLGRARAELDSKTVEAQLQKNWFSDTNAVRLYSLFLELDRDQNGMYCLYCSAACLLRTLTVTACTYHRLSLSLSLCLSLCVSLSLPHSAMFPPSA